MRYGKLVFVLALCLCSAGARAQIATTMATATTAAPTGMLAQAWSGLSGLPTQSGVAATLKGVKESLAASVAPMLDGFGAVASSVGNQYEALAQQMEVVVAAAEAEYCTPAEFTPSEKKPATFVGHSMAVTFSMGGCTFDEKKWIQDDIKELNCTEPSISYEKAPANFTSKRHTAPSFTSKECKITKTFGESVEKVLFVFDGQQAPDINSLTAKITEEVKNILGTVQNGAKDLISNAGSMVSGGKKKMGSLL